MAPTQVKQASVSCICVGIAAGEIAVDETKYEGELVNYDLRWTILSLALVSLAGCDSAKTASGNEAPPPLLEPGQIEIRVDSMGIPHVYGGTDEDVFFGYGYQVASDRPFQLAMFRRQALGRSAEVLGEFGALRDSQARVFNWRDWGHRDAEWMSQNEPERFRLIEAYVEGINRRFDEIRSGEVARPFGFSESEHDFLPENWTAQDVYVVQKMAAFALDLSLEFEVFMTFANRLFPSTLEGVELFKPARHVFGLAPDERAEEIQTAMRWQGDFTPSFQPSVDPVGLIELAQGLSSLRNLGSNNWAVDGRHTASGRPLLAGDPHMRFDYSGLVYAIHLDSASSAGRYDVAGFAFVGAPGIAMGHNRHVVWSPTSTFGDVMDMWEVKIDDEGAHVADSIVPVVEREERYTVRGDGDEVGEGREAVLVVTDVPDYGTVLIPSAVGSPLPIARNGQHAIIGWTGFSTRPARYFLELNDVKSVDEFEEAVLRMGEMSYNFVAADATGIRYRVGLDVPKRESIVPGREPWRLMDGSDGAAWWSGEMLSPDDLPRSDGGERGFIVTANTDPFGFTSNGRLDDDPFYWSAFFVPGWRQDRIVSELNRMIDQGPLTVEDMMSLQTDTHSNLADDLLPVVEAAWSSDPTDEESLAIRQDPDVVGVVAILSDWDRRMVRDSQGALVFQTFSNFLTSEVLQDDLPVLFNVVMEMHSIYLLKVAMLAVTGQFSDAAHILQDGVEQIVFRALNRTAQFVRERFGEVVDGSYRYGDLHKVRFDGAFGMGTRLMDVPADGGESTVNVSASHFFTDGEPSELWYSEWIPMDRLIGSFTEAGQPQVHLNFPLGNVAEPTSPHHGDHLDFWIEGRYQRLLFERQEVVEDAPTPLNLKR